MSHLLKRIAQEKHADLEAWEAALRAAVLAAGADLLQRLLDGIGSGRPDEPVKCDCGTEMTSLGRKEKVVLTILGPVRFKRSLFQCSACGTTRFPGDEVLDIVDTGRSPGLRRMMARAGSSAPFKAACEDLRIYAGIEVSPKDLERVAEKIGEHVEGWAKRERRTILREAASSAHAAKTIPVMYVSYDGTGVPMTRRELRGRKGKQADGSAKTREVKVGCVFTQTATDAEGRPVRDEASTSFVAAIEPSNAFGERIYAEVVRRGKANARTLVVLGDGAEWIKTIAEQYFPSAFHIVDLYHAREHVAALCRLLHPHDDKRRTARRHRWWKLLDTGNIEKLIEKAKSDLPRSGTRRKAALVELAYFDKNRERMRYATFRAKGLFVGSGVIEAGCRTVVAQRLKQSGMEWSKRGANAIIGLRAITISGRFEDYWEDRAA